MSIDINLFINQRVEVTLDASPEDEKYKIKAVWTMVNNGEPSGEVSGDPKDVPIAVDPFPGRVAFAASPNGLSAVISSGDVTGNSIIWAEKPNGQKESFVVTVKERPAPKLGAAVGRITDIKVGEVADIEFVSLSGGK